MNNFFATNQNQNQSPRIYLDYAAATPLKEAVWTEMMPFFTSRFGNASSIHLEGQIAKHALETARTKVARILEIKSAGVIFTASGTESNNLAILGHLEFLHKQGRAFNEMEVVTTGIEHPSIGEVMKKVAAWGVVVKYVEVDTRGLIKIPSLQAALSEKTVLVTFAYANSEVGAVQPVLKLVRQVRRWEGEQEHQGGQKSAIFVHLDAAQAPLWLPCAFKQLGVDSLALDAGKCYGPKGVGVLAFRDKLAITPQLLGGEQEEGLRSGTENVAGIVGMAKALELAQADFKNRSEKVAKVRDEAFVLLKEIFGEAVEINGGGGSERLPNNINFSLLDVDTEFAVVYLDKHGVAASTKSACAGAGGGQSAVVLALTGDAARARTTIRFSLGEDTTLDDIKTALTILQKFKNELQV